MQCTKDDEVREGGRGGGEGGREGSSYLPGWPADVERGLHVEWLHLGREGGREGGRRGRMSQSASKFHNHRDICIDAILRLGREDGGKEGRREGGKEAKFVLVPPISTLPLPVESCG